MPRPPRVAGHVPARRDEAQRSAPATSASFSPDELASNRWNARVRRDGPLLGRRDTEARRPRRARRPRDGSPVGAPVRRLARRLSAERPARLLLVLRGVHPHRRLDVQPAREMAEGVAAGSLAGADRLAQHRPVVARLATGPQRIFAPGPGLHRSRREQEGGDRSGSTCRPTPTRCSRSPTRACAAATSST